MIAGAIAWAGSYLAPIAGPIASIATFIATGGQISTALGVGLETHLFMNCRGSEVPVVSNQENMILVHSTAGSSRTRLIR